MMIIQVILTIILIAIMILIVKLITSSRIKYKKLLILVLLLIMILVIDVVHSEFEERVISDETVTEFIESLQDINIDYRTIENGNITNIFYIESNIIKIKVFQTNDKGETIDYYSIQTLLEERFSEMLTGYEGVYRFIYDVKSPSYFNSDTLKHVYIYCIDCDSDSVSTINGFEKVDFSNGSSIWYKQLKNYKDSTYSITIDSNIYELNVKKISQSIFN